ncbi:hypothetical protein [Phenylobacterium sp.]|jgi:hypothetical protein|uniref:hypothetical protein n=1 Tax=Phenylobacterium sp. TaxID=1871053 RepID=UPI0037843DB5
MVARNYLGISDPKAAFEALRPYRNELIRLKTMCKPLGADYLVLDAAMQALDTAAYHFTRDPYLFVPQGGRS